MSVIPKTNVDFWSRKISRNRERDHEARVALKALGWHTVEIWECQLKPKERMRTLQGLLRTLNIIALENEGAKFRYDFDYDETSSVAAEDSDEG